MDYKLHKYQGTKHGSQAKTYEPIEFLGRSAQELQEIEFSKEQFESRDKPLPLDVIAIRSRDFRLSPAQEFL